MTKVRINIMELIKKANLSHGDFGVFASFLDAFGDKEGDMILEGEIVDVDSVEEKCEHTKMWKDYKDDAVCAKCGFNFSDVPLIEVFSRYYDASGCANLNPLVDKLNEVIKRVNSIR